MAWTPGFPDPVTFCAARWWNTLVYGSGQLPAESSPVGTETMRATDAKRRVGFKPLLSYASMRRETSPANKTYICRAYNERQAFAVNGHVKRASDNRKGQSCGTRHVELELQGGPYLSTLLDILDLVGLGILLVTVCLAETVGALGITHGLLPMKLDLFASKQSVNVLQRQIPCFWIVEIDKGKKAKVEDAEVDVCAPSDAADAHRGDFHDKESEYPVGCRRERGGTRPNGKRSILGRHCTSMSIRKKHMADEETLTEPWDRQ